MKNIKILYRLIVLILFLVGLKFNSNAQANTGKFELEINKAKVGINIGHIEEEHLKQMAFSSRDLLVLVKYIFLFNGLLTMSKIMRIVLLLKMNTITDYF